MTSHNFIWNILFYFSTATFSSNFRDGEFLLFHLHPIALSEIQAWKVSWRNRPILLSSTKRYLKCTTIYNLSKKNNKNCLTYDAKIVKLSSFSITFQFWRSRDNLRSSVVVLIRLRERKKVRAKIALAMTQLNNLMYLSPIKEKGLLNVCLVG